uniref:Uncharacterized protein n=1 Tax=Oryza meridionalis TaxID=40149 RepID=A0A0E0EI28_9ORYZ
MSRLAVRFTAQKRWILLHPFDATMLGLRELLVVNVPPTWDVSAGARGAAHRHVRIVHLFTDIQAAAAQVPTSAMMALAREGVWGGATVGAMGVALSW